MWPKWKASAIFKLHIWFVNLMELITALLIISFPPDQIFPPDASTKQVYANVARGITLSTMEGINGTIFAYGQTSSGKTFTMRGAPSAPGIIQQAVDDIFAYIEKVW